MVTAFDLWAKTEPFQSVPTHSLVTGIVAQQLWDCFLAEGTKEQISKGLTLAPMHAYKFLGYFASLHDIGKIHPSFQSLQAAAKMRLRENGLMDGWDDVSPFRHEKESQKAASRIWEKIDRRNGARLAQILGAHHQGKEGRERQREAEGSWITLQEDLEAQMRTHFLGQDPIFPRIDKNMESAVSALLLGIVILSDWIASGDWFRDAEQWEHIEGMAKERAQKFLKESGLLQTAQEYGQQFHQVWPNIPLGCERELQSSIQDLFINAQQRYSLILLEAPMGEGKTEAGVYAAVQMMAQWKKYGFYIGLPTSATSNQMAGRMNQFLNMHQQSRHVKLLHSMAWMVDAAVGASNEFSTEEETFARQWLMPVRRGLLASYGVGTVDQAMMAAMFIKYGVLRLLGLAGKALVVDEIHAYDTYMQNILQRLLEWCRALEIPVVLLSATLPPEKKRQLLGSAVREAECPYPSITAVTEAGEVQTIPVKAVAKRQVYGLEILPLLHKPKQIAEAALEKIHCGGCMCILLNTVKQAQDTFLAIREAGFSGALLLFHSRFPAGQRDEIERRCVSLFGKDKTYRPQKAILIATQVVEQSLDVDFDFLLSAAAPIDLLLQRMGRQFRHDDTPRPGNLQMPTLTVLVPEDHSWGVDRFVYPACLLDQTLRLLKDRDQIRIPEDIAGLVADGYDSEKVPQVELDDWVENLMEQQLRGAAADQYLLWPPKKRFRPLVENVDFDDLEQQSYLSAQTRLSEPSVRVALVGSELFDKLLSQSTGGVLAVKDVTLAKEIFLHSVSVNRKKYDRNQKKSNLLDLNGDKLIAGVKVIPSDNPCLTADPDLGILWKEESV